MNMCMNSNSNSGLGKAGVVISLENQVDGRK